MLKTVKDALTGPSRNLVLAIGLAGALLGGLTVLAIVAGSSGSGTGGMAGFEQVCGTAADRGGTAPSKCRDIESINREFGIQIMQDIERNHVRMVATARRIQTGDLTDPASYRACIADGSCAAVPLLPPGVDVTKIDPQSTDYLEIRTAFWGLVEDRALGPEVCAYIRTCDIAMKTGAIVFEKAVPTVSPAPQKADAIVIQSSDKGATNGVSHD